MEKCDKKRIMIQVAVHADAVIVKPGAMPVISQNGFPVFCDGKMNFIIMQVLCNCIKSQGWQIILKMIDWSFFRGHVILQMNSVIDNLKKRNYKVHFLKS